ncbi:hypothetical protein N657DRAFT_4204 [Parathielavia appendiculata]|uniref:Uncharacterized protein n=1 Tax=Parathielavia appendiculata TaxID=2587402 RepID=A0AAN6U7X5_9PEZI|nr:hypothetical protein N657DRAFT_4204 [Parathielavia appendiculata]
MCQDSKLLTTGTVRPLEAWLRYSTGNHYESTLVCFVSTELSGYYTSSSFTSTFLYSSFPLLSSFLSCLSCLLPQFTLTSSFIYFVFFSLSSFSVLLLCLPSVVPCMSNACVTLSDKPGLDCRLYTKSTTSSCPASLSVSFEGSKESMGGIKMGVCRRVYEGDGCDTGRYRAGLGLGVTPHHWWGGCLYVDKIRLPHSGWWDISHHCSCCLQLPEDDNLTFPRIHGICPFFPAYGSFPYQDGRAIMPYRHLGTLCECRYLKCPNIHHHIELIDVFFPGYGRLSPLPGAPFHIRRRSSLKAGQ